MLLLYARHRLSILLAICVVAGSLVSGYTTAAGLLNLLQDDAELKSEWSAWVDWVEAGLLVMLAILTTFLIQVLVVALSVYLGIHLVALVSKRPVDASESIGARLWSWLKERSGQVLSAGVLALILFPFITVSILFSYATFHKRLEPEAEVMQKATGELRDQFIEGKKQLVLDLSESREPMLRAVRNRFGSKEFLERSVRYQANIKRDIILFTAAAFENDTAELKQGEIDEIDGSIKVVLVEIQRSVRELIDAEMTLVETEFRLEWEHGATQPPDFQRVASVGRCRRGFLNDLPAASDVDDYIKVYALIDHIFNSEGRGHWKPELLSNIDEIDQQKLRISSAYLKEIVEILKLAIEEDNITEISRNQNRARSLFSDIRNMIIFLTSNDYLTLTENCGHGEGETYNTLKARWSTASAQRTEVIKQIDALNENLKGLRKRLKSVQEAIRVDRSAQDRATVGEISQELKDAFGSYGDGFSLENIVADAPDIIDLTVWREITEKLRDIGRYSCVSGQLRLAGPDEEIPAGTDYSSCLDKAAKLCVAFRDALLEVQEIPGAPRKAATDCSAYEIDQAVLDFLYETSKVLIELENVKPPQFSTATDPKAAFDEVRTEVFKKLGEVAAATEGAAGVSKISRTLADFRENLYQIESKSSTRRSWNRMSRMLDRLPERFANAWLVRQFSELAGALASLGLQFGAADEPLADSPPSAAESGLDSYQDEFRAFGIAVTIDAMIIVLSMLIVLMRRTPVSEGARLYGGDFDESLFEDALSGLAREDPSIFSAVLLHSRKTRNGDYPLKIVLSDLRKPELRQRARVLLALLSHDVEPDEAGEDHFLLSRNAVITLGSLADAEGISAPVDPMAPA